MHPNTLIFSAEAMAILKATTYLEKIDHTKILIITDSLSTVKHIQTINRNSKVNPIIFKILNQIDSLKFHNKLVEFVWIPSHTGVSGNDTADSLAKLSGKLQEINIPNFPANDLKQIIKSNLIHDWQNYWNQSSLTKGYNLFNIQELVDNKPWFHNQNLSRKQIVVLSRLRTGHNVLPKHLNRLKMAPEEICHCQESQPVDINHILFICPDYREPRVDMLRILGEENLVTPYNINQILKEKNIKINHALVNFISNINIRI